MGEENCLPTVEESTEPPICAQHSGNYNGPDSNGQQPTNLRVKDGTKSAPTAFNAAHTLTPAQVAAKLDVNTDHGLSVTEAESRFRFYGPNKVKGAKGLSVWEILLRQVSNSLTVVLVITMGLSFAISDYIEGGVITAVILLNIVVGFFQDYKAEKKIRSLEELTQPRANVLRDGVLVNANAVDLVPGDIVHINVGDIVPADVRIIEGTNAAADEALLTGESLPVTKMPSMIFDDVDLAVGDRINLAYFGTSMTAGRATAIVINTGMRTEVGKIADMLRNAEKGPRSPTAFKRFCQRMLYGIKSTLGLIGTPLTVSLSKFALLLFALAILLAIIVFSANKWQVGGEVLIYGICVAVAVIPESLLAVLTLTVAKGAATMAERNVYTRKMQSMEAIGGVTNICSDKTGTLTQGRMVAQKALVSGVGNLTVHDISESYNPTSGFLKLNERYLDIEKYTLDSKMQTFLNTIALCNLSSIRWRIYETLLDHDESSGTGTSTSSISDDATDTDTATQGSIIRPPTVTGDHGKWEGIGEPTEIALQVLAHRFGMGKPNVLERLDMVYVAEFPFDSSVKKMTVVYRNTPAGHLEAFTKGAAEFIVPRLNATEFEKQTILETAEGMASDGLRVLCIAHRILPLDSPVFSREEIECNLEYIGLVGIHDPLRRESAGAVRACQLAGITVHMLTGDHPATARAIAREAGILQPNITNTGTNTAVMKAADFDKKTDAELDAMETLPLVVARCSPTTKVKMIQAMHRRKAYCVMTGDGVNDAPALKLADVGVAMGDGSGVATEAAEMVLSDNNFASIVNAVEEGRRLFDNIQKFLMHLLISNIAQVILLLIGLAFKDADNHSVFPLSPIEILWVNLITSSFLAIGLGLEEAQQDILFRPPHSLQVGVFTRELIVDKFIYGFFMGALCLASFSIVAYVGPGGGYLGSGCNEDYNSTCDIVFRARATTYATITLLLLVTAWEVKHFSRSLFNLYPDAESLPVFSVFPALWRNRVLFWAVIAGFTIMFPIVYIPVINRQVFKHAPITWEWGVSFGCLVIYVAAIESWKAVKRKLRIGSGKFKVLSREDAEARAGLGDTERRKKKVEKLNA